MSDVSIIRTHQALIKLRHKRKRDEKHIKTVAHVCPIMGNVKGIYNSSGNIIFSHVDGKGVIDG